MDLDPNKTYDYHTALLLYIVDLDMNRKKILNIALDQNRSNSAATVKMKKICILLQKIMHTGQYLKNFMISVMLVTIN